MLIERATKLREEVEGLVSLSRLSEDTRLLDTRAYEVVPKIWAATGPAEASP